MLFTDLSCIGADIVDLLRIWSHILKKSLFENEKLYFLCCLKFLI